MHALLDPRVLAPLIAIVLMQSAITMGSYGIGVIAPNAAGDIGIPPEWVGYLTATVYGSAALTGLASGRIAALAGPTLAFRLMMLLVAAAMVALLAAQPALAFLAALLLGIATGPMNPMGSFVLARVAPAGWRPLVFSLKQCATPAGGMLAGAVLPPLTLLWGWQGAVAVLPVVALAFAALAGWGRLGGRQPRSADGAGTTKPGGGVLESVGLALGGRQVAAASVAGLLMAGSQVTLSAYLVVFLWRDAGMTPAAAGAAFSVMHLSGIVARIVLGLVADRQIAAATLLPVLAAVMALSLCALGNASPDWPVWAVYLAIVVCGATGNGWVGLLFSEFARLAPDGRTAEVAGGGQLFMYGGVVLTPLACNAALGWTGRYGALFAILAGAAFVAWLVLWWGRRGAGRQDSTL